jgi:hypothetical protein
MVIYIAVAETPVLELRVLVESVVYTTVQHAREAPSQQTCFVRIMIGLHVICYEHDENGEQQSEPLLAHSISIGAAIAIAVRKYED